MLLDSRLHFAVGCGLIFILMWTLFAFSPAPGELSLSHAGLSGGGTITTCSTCHKAGGLEEGCLDCHREIATQLESDHGFHDFLAGEGDLRCGACHAEHFGHEFPLVSEASWGDLDPTSFSHPHVEFGLEGSHTELDCESCHREMLPKPFTLEAFPDAVRLRTFLGLRQDCATCHVDPHADGRAPCADCHSQESFDSPEHFDHAAHFSLAGAHVEVECQACHPMPAADAAPAPLPFPFGQPKGKECASCHESPHQIEFGESCESCHALDESHWTFAVSDMTVARHARTGFPLEHPHDEVACSQCHAPEKPFEERHPDPLSAATARKPESCGSCHGDVHGGQFASRYGACLDCHESHAFVPSTFDPVDHERLFELTGAHQNLGCATCHATHADDDFRRFSGTPQECRACHAGPHAGQFQRQISQADCTACHREIADTFAIRPFDHGDRTGFSLRGAHAEVDCGQCHPNELFEHQEAKQLARRFEGTERDCTFCHQDVHQGQFADREGDCLSCHDTRFFKPTTFDHGDHASVFPLTGAHEAIPCTSCHAKPTVASARLFEGTAQSCKQCHADPHAGQFALQIELNDCRACHNGQADTFTIRPFDHQAWTGFELQGAHVRAKCASCHVEQTFEVDGAPVVAQRFVKTSQECGSCHEDIHRGQFEDYRSCATCHVSQSRWSDIQFDHNNQSRFKLEGSHLKVACSGCHEPVPIGNDTHFVRFKPLGTDCIDCHEIDPRTKDK